MDTTAALEAAIEEPACRSFSVHPHPARWVLEWDEAEEGQDTFITRAVAVCPIHLNAVLVMITDRDADTVVSVLSM